MWVRQREDRAVDGHHKLEKRKAAAKLRNEYTKENCKVKNRDKMCFCVCMRVCVRGGRERERRCVRKKET